MTTPDDLHAAVCRAVALLNVSLEVAGCADGREARDILRQALVDYADAYMDQPVTAEELERHRKGHASKVRKQ